MKLKLFQKQDLARAALHDGLILSWDTGLWKTGAGYLWPLVKVGYFKAPKGSSPAAAIVPSNHDWTIRPKSAVLQVVPGDLHIQTAREGMDKFNVETIALSSQEQFLALTRRPNSMLPNLTADGRPVMPPGYYITSYTQLTTNGVGSPPDPDKWEDPIALMQWLCLKPGDHVANADVDSNWGERPDFDTVCHFFAWRGIRWNDEYHRLSVHPDDTLSTLQKAYDREMMAVDYIQDPKIQAREKSKITEAYVVLKNLMTMRPCPHFDSLGKDQQGFVIRAFCTERISRYSGGIGMIKEYPIGPVPEGYVCDRPETDTRLKWRIKCVYQPSLADLCYNAFDCVTVDEGVKMKGADTIVGKGVRSLTPKYRMVMTATPVKNRVPDIFWLAWWAVGGRTEAHARFPYRDDVTEQSKFAETFMVSERNVTKEKNAAAKGERVTNSRYRKLTAEVCNVHLLWKLLGPIVLRRRKADAGEDIVPKIRRVIRCEMGTWQQRAYRYHLGATYTDKNGRPAVGAQLQALRMAAADPSSDHLLAQPGEPTEECSCRNGARASCRLCHGSGRVPLPYRSGQAYIPKIATTLALIQEILQRQEQVVVFSAFNDPLDNMSRYLDEAGVRHVKLDGRVSQKKRGTLAGLFKRGRNAEFGEDQSPVPVMLAGVECMAEGHSFHLANNVILIAYSWAYDKFIQAINRVHRMNSPKPVNIYVVICTGTIDRKLESLIQDKGDAAELVLDGRLIGERTEEVNLAELLRIAKKEFDEKNNTLDEAMLHAQWPNLRDQLATAMRAWEPEHPMASTNTKPMNPRNTTPKIARLEPATLQAPVTALPASRAAAGMPTSAAPDAAWRARIKERAARLARVQGSSNPWAQL